MRYMRELWHDLRCAVRVGLAQWRYVRSHLRRGGNPDESEAF